MKKIAIAFACLLIVAGVIYALLDHGIIWFVYPDRAQFPVHGIDVSYHKGEIDWEKVSHDDVSFVFLKATEGDDFKDPLFEQNWDHARAQGLAVGAYHFYSLRFDGAVQAQNFIDTVPIASRSLAPVIDLEYGGNSSQRPTRADFQRELTTYISRVRNHYGKEPILYVTSEFYHDYLAGDFADSPLWVRSLFREPSTDTFPGWQYWQYKNRGHVDGIEGYVDLNVYK